MIDRYTNKALEGLFSDESRFQAYWEIELAVLEAYVSLGIVPAKDYELIKSKAKVDVKRIKEIEEITRHDVVAFTRQVGEGLGEEKRWIHYGLTSTDVVDTAMSLLYKKANAVIIEHIDSLLKARPTCYVLASFPARWATSPTSIRKSRKWSPLNLV